MITDPISDMLTRIRNAAIVRQQEVRMPYSQIKFHLAKILEKEGFVAGVEKVDGLRHPELKIALSYRAGASAIRSIKRISKPGRRVYSKSDELPHVLSGQGIAIVSTPNGLMTNKEARSRRLGGEILCEVF